MIDVSRPSTPTAPPQDRWIPAFLILAPLACGLLALYLGQDVSWDMRNYHWYNAYAFVTGRYARDLDYEPSRVQFFLNPLVDVPFYVLGAHFTARVTAFALGALQGLNIVLLFLLARLTLPDMRRKAAASAAVAALGMLGGMGISEIGTVFNDNIVSLGIYLTALLVLKDGGRLSPGHAVLAAIPAGMMAGLKLTVAPFCIGLLLALPVLGTGRRGFAGFGLGLAAGFMITYGYWGYFLYTHYGSPMFPFFNNIFRSPLLPPAQLADTRYVDRNRIPLLLPFMLAKDPMMVSEIVWRDWRLPVLYVLAPLAVGWHPAVKSRASRDDRRAHYLLAMAWVSYLVWMNLFCIYRYLLPLDMIAPLLIALSCGLMPARGQTRLAVAAAALVLVAASVRPGDWGRRSAWSAHVVDVTRPRLDDTGDTMILLSGFGNAVGSYLLSDFPQGIPLVRIDGLALSMDKPLTAPIDGLIRRKIEAHHGRFLLLTPGYEPALTAGTLAAFGLSMSPARCETVTDNIYTKDQPAVYFPPAYKLCAVTRARLRPRGTP